MAIGWNLWVWLQCIGVVSGCCRKGVHVYRYPHNNYLFSLLHLYSLFFWQQHPYFFVHIKNIFYVLIYVISVQYITNVTQRTFENVQKIEITRIIIII